MYNTLKNHIPAIIKLLEEDKHTELSQLLQSARAEVVFYNYSAAAWDNPLLYFILNFSVDAELYLKNKNKICEFQRIVEEKFAAILAGAGAAGIVISPLREEIIVK